MALRRRGRARLSRRVPGLLCPQARRSRPLAPRARGREADGLRLPERRRQIDDAAAVRPLVRRWLSQLLLLRPVHDGGPDQAPWYRSRGGLQPGRADVRRTRRGGHPLPRVQPRGRGRRSAAGEAAQAAHGGDRDLADRRRARAGRRQSRSDPAVVETASAGGHVAPCRRHLVPGPLPRRHRRALELARPRRGLDAFRLVGLEPRDPASIGDHGVPPLHVPVRRPPCTHDGAAPRDHGDRRWPSRSFWRVRTSRPCPDAS